MSLWTYNPEEITVLVAGIPLEGMVEESFVSLSRDAPLFDTTVTADGRVVRTYNAHDIWTMRFTLMNSSPSNGMLHKLSLADRVSRRGKFPLMVKDGQGGTLVFSTTSWVEVLPEITYSVTGTEREWVIRSANAVVSIDGNGEPSSLGEDVLNTVLSALPGFF